MGHGTCREYEPRQSAGACEVVAALQIVCAWCQQPLGWHRVPPPLPFTISYGICARCYAEVSQELDPLTRSMAHPPCAHAEDPTTPARLASTARMVEILDRVKLPRDDSS
jgi:hypothetical protein